MSEGLWQAISRLCRRLAAHNLRSRMCGLLPVSSAHDCMTALRTNDTDDEEVHAMSLRHCAAIEDQKSLGLLEAWSV